MCTKFNIGDAVWAFDITENSVIEFVVDSINIEGDDVYYTIEASEAIGYYREAFVFESKEECVKYYTRLFLKMSVI